MKALEVSLDGRVIGIFVPPPGEPFVAMVGNIPRSYMRAHVVSGNLSESWQWQLPDVSEGQTISFRMIEAAAGSGIPPQYVRERDPEEIEESKRMAAECLEQAMKEREARRTAPIDS
jgi:hypothetical protein